MRKGVLNAFLAAVFLFVFLCAAFHQGSVMHDNTKPLGVRLCCKIVAAPSGLDLVKVNAVTVFFDTVFFVLMVFFLIPSKVPIRLYHPPRY